MKTKKIRGHHRIWRRIEKWRKAHINLDLEYLKEYGNDYAGLVEFC